MNNNINQNDMTMSQKITPLKNSEDYEKLKTTYEAEKENLKAKVEEWKNVAIKRDETIFEKDKLIERLAEEKEDWKREANAARRIQSETKQAKEQNDFNQEFIKLQQKKGWHWDDSQGWIKA
jgi:aspartyl/asparaginyl beta-hydroxylase (cupin superfamily)